MSKRVKFAIMGWHPLMGIVRNYFILVKKFELVPNQYDADFVLASALDSTSGLVCTQPALVLSTDDAYTGRDLQGKTMEKAPMSETWMTVIHPTDSLADSVGRVLQGESYWLRRKKKQTMLLRCFNVYGPRIDSGVVHIFMRTAEECQEMHVDAPGYQTRTFLYEEDFLECVDNLVDKFLTGTVGIFNVGSDEEITIKNLAQTIGQTLYPAAAIIESKSAVPHRFWKLPDLTRTKAVANWAPSTSIRKGLWRMTHASGLHQ